MGGIAVNALGHAHPHLVAALKDQADRLWHVSNIFQIPGQEELGKRLDRRKPLPIAVFFFTNSGAEALGMRDQDRPPLSLCQRGPGPLPVHHVRRRVPRQDPGDNRCRRPGEKYLEGFGPRVEGFDQVRVRRPRGSQSGNHATQTAGILIEPGPGRRRDSGRFRTSACAGCANSATKHGILLDPGRDPVRHGPHRESCLPMNGPGLRRTSWPLPRRSAAGSRSAHALPRKSCFQPA